MSSIQLRGGVYQAHFKAWDGAAGEWKWTSKSTRTADKDEAERICAEFQELARQAAGPLSDSQLHEATLATLNSILRIAGRPPVPTCPTLAAYAEHFLAGRESGGVTEATAKTYRSHLRSLRATVGSDTLLDRVTPQRVLQWHRGAVEARTASAANAQLKTVRAMFDQAQREGLVARNPAATVRLAPVESLERDPFTREQVASILAHCERTGDKAARWLTACGLCLGARIRDCATLKVGDFQPHGDGGLLCTFRPAKTRGTGKAITLPVLPPLLDIAKAEIEGRDPGEFCVPDLASIRDSSALSAVFTDVCEALGIEGSELSDHGAGKRWRRRSHHSLRHSMNQFLQSAGADREIRMGILGQTTERANEYYSATQIDRLTAYMKKALSSPS